MVGITLVYHLMRTTNRIIATLETQVQHNRVCSGTLSLCNEAFAIMSSFATAVPSATPGNSPAVALYAVTWTGPNYSRGLRHPVTLPQFCCSTALVQPAASVNPSTNTLYLPSLLCVATIVDVRTLAGRQQQAINMSNSTAEARSWGEYLNAYRGDFGSRSYSTVSQSPPVQRYTMS